MFTSNILFSRIAKADMSDQAPQVDTAQLKAEDILLSPQGMQRQKLTHAYSILVSRIMCNMTTFKFLGRHIPSHIPHPYAEKMAVKSTVIPLPLQFKNEAKHEDCLAVMDTYEKQLHDMFTSAFG